MSEGGPNGHGRENSPQDGRAGQGQAVMKAKVENCPRPQSHIFQKVNTKQAQQNMNGIMYHFHASTVRWTFGSRTFQ